MNCLAVNLSQIQLPVSDCLLHCKAFQLSLIYLVGAENQVAIYSKLIMKSSSKTIVWVVGSLIVLYLFPLIQLGILIVTVTALDLVSGNFTYGENQPPFVVEERPNVDELKQKLLYIEDLEPGHGSVATWGRKISADVEVGYTDGTIIYKGPIVFYHGFKFMYQHRVPNLMSNGMLGIRYGVEGMAIGGKRRLMIHPEWACGGVGYCVLIQPRTYSQEKWVKLSSETLVVKITLTDSCAPRGFQSGFMMGGQVISSEVGCRRQ